MHFPSQLRISFRAAMLAVAATCASVSGADPIPRRIPPAGIELAADVRSELVKRSAKLKQELEQIEHPRSVDAEVFCKAVDYALRHGEFYRDRDVEVAKAALDECRQRIVNLREDRTPWSDAHGLVVRGYRSSVDDSVQPYGLWIAEDVDFDKAVPLYVWLHGRGDKVTDLHFIQRRMTREGTITPPGAIVLHPFGRHCVGFKSAGERDVLEAIEDVAREYKIDRDRIVLMGFSMGGAGAWHIGAHYGDKWVAVSAGAGFAETAKYNRLAPADFPVWYEQRLWGIYDVPNYVRNLFNLPTIAYSGENDRQIQAARVMEEAFQQWNRELPHLIGPGMGHKYHPDTLAEILNRIDEAVRAGRPQNRRQISLQTRTLRYNKFDWLSILALEQHWSDARVDAKIQDQTVEIETVNVKALALSPMPLSGQVQINIDGQQLSLTNHASANGQVQLHHDQEWRLGAQPPALRKRPGLQGPIDDAFLDAFLVVTPTGEAWHAEVQEWIEFELAHFQDRWRALFRGEVRTKPDTEVTPEDMASMHCILWGDPASNRLIAKCLATKELPLRWDSSSVTIGAASFSSTEHVPVLIYPNPLQPDKYVVLNSGPTFREAHDRTNSLQNPKLPDWAILDIRQQPNAEVAGRVAAANFFDESWQPKTQP